MDDQESSLYQAVLSGENEYVDAFFEDIDEHWNYTYLKHNLTSFDHTGLFTPLHRAVMHDNPFMVNFILNYPLHRAPDLFDIVRSQYVGQYIGNRPFSSKYQGYSALDIAVLNGYKGVSNVLKQFNTPRRIRLPFELA